MILDDERPRSTWIEQLFLADRLQPEPALIPSNADDRVLMFGITNEICGENGLGWQRRHILIDETVNNPKTDDRTRNFWRRFGGKYGYTPEAVAAAPARSASILKFLSARIEGQKAKGSRYFIGNQLTALDIYWATFSAIIRPLPVELCPMADSFRIMYTEKDSKVAAAMSPALIEHRDFIYREYLELPIVF